MSPGPVDAAVLLARAYLSRVAEPPAPALLELVRREGAVAAAERVRRGEVSGAIAAETGARRHLDMADADLAAATAMGGRLVVPEDPEWPAWPFTAFTPAVADAVEGMVAPLALWVRGRAGSTSSPSARWPSSVPGRPPDTASTLPPT